MLTNSLLVTLFLSKPELICLHTIKWFLVLLSNINSFICTQLNCSKYYHIKLSKLTSVIFLLTVKWLSKSIWLIGGILTGITTLGQSRPGSNGNKGAHYIPQSSRTEAALSGRLLSYPGHSLMGSSYPSAGMQLAYSTAPADWAELFTNDYFTYVKLYNYL